LAVPGAIERASRKGHTLKETIERYLVEAEKARPLGETKRRTLNAIKNSYLGEKVTLIGTRCGGIPICMGEGMGIKARRGWIRLFRHRLNSASGLSSGWVKRLPL